MFSAKGAVVTNIAHIPAALTAVMRANATHARLRARRHLALKPWFGSDEGLDAAATSCACRWCEALAPYNEQVALLNTQIGGVVPRQTMKDASGASQMDAKTQVSSLHGIQHARRGARCRSRPTSRWRCCTTPAARTTAS